MTFEYILLSGVCLAILTANSSLYSKSKFRFTIVLSLFVLNHAIGVYGIRNSLRYGIIYYKCMESMQIALYGISLTRVWNPSQDGMESRPKKMGDTRQAVMPYARWAIPYNSQSELMPYTSPSVLNKNNLNRIFRFRLFLVE